MHRSVVVSHTATHVRPYIGVLLFCFFCVTTRKPAAATQSATVYLMSLLYRNATRGTHHKGLGPDPELIKAALGGVLTARHQAQGNQSRL